MAEDFGKTRSRGFWKSIRQTNLYLITGRKSMLTIEKKEYFKNLLIQRLDELLVVAKKTVNEMTGLNDTFSDPSDRATAESERNFTLRIRDREHKLIGKIREALERIDYGTYGICEECNEEISEKRLKARPVTTLCIECKKKQEVEEK